MWGPCALAVGAFTALSFVTAQDSVSFDIDTYGKDDPSGTPYQTFMSNVDVKPPQLQINSNKTGLADGLVFIGVDGEPTSGQNWVTIYDMSEERMGTLVWTANYTEPFDFKAQTYKGEPVLTFFSGKLLNGYGHGSYYILNQSYVEIAHFSPVGFENLGDLHEFAITSDDTALVIIYTAKQADLTELGGVEDGWIFDCIFQELNIETGELVFSWNATTHVGLNETYNTIEDVGTEDAPFDYFHMNSVQKDGNGDYLVSARVMDCVYKISGNDGSIIWRLQGKQSDFDVEDEATFAFQHDARWLNDNQTRMTIFDNGPTDAVGYSRGLLFAVDQDQKTIKLTNQFYNANQTLAIYEGSLQAIDPSDENTNYFLGYGSQPYFAEFDKDANLLLDVQFGATNVVNSYRAYRLAWQGKPLTKPDIHFDKDGNKAYCSWNGATDVERWIVYTANATNSSTWYNVTSATRTGFETTIDLSDVELNTYVRAKAVDGKNAKLGWTRASDGNQLYDDSSDDVNESSLPSSQNSTLTPSATSTSTSSSVTVAATSTTTTGAAMRVRGKMVEQVFVVIVAIGGLALA